LKKIDSLKKLKELIRKDDVELSAGKYFIEEANCSCVIGHLLKIGGLTNEQLNELDNGKYEDYYSIDSIIDIINTGQYRDNDFITPTLNSLGFDIDEDKFFLSMLQVLNDGGEPIHRLVIEIDNKINQLEAEIEGGK
jgi:hypothetical protein